MSTTSGFAGAAMEVTTVKKSIERIVMHNNNDFMTASLLVDIYCSSRWN
jgi:hypothetical protein